MSGASTRARFMLLPEGWSVSAKGLWHHENGARVESTGKSNDQKYLAKDADGVFAYCESRAEAFAWGSGEVVS